MFFFRFWLFLKEIQQRNTYDSYKCIEYQLGWVYSKISKKKPYLYLTGIDMFLFFNFFQKQPKTTKRERRALEEEEEEELRILVFCIFYCWSENAWHASIVQISCQHERWECRDERIFRCATISWIQVSITVSLKVNHTFLFQQTASTSTVVFGFTIFI